MKGPLLKTATTTSQIARELLRCGRPLPVESNKLQKTHSPFNKAQSQHETRCGGPGGAMCTRADYSTSAKPTAGVSRRAVGSGSSPFRRGGQSKVLWNLGSRGVANREISGVAIQMTRQDVSRLQDVTVLCPPGPAPNPPAAVASPAPTHRAAAQQKDASPGTYSAYVFAEELYFLSKPWHRLTQADAAGSCATCSSRQHQSGKCNTHT